MYEQRYFASNEKDEAEINRLRSLEEICDTNTIRRLEMMRASESWDCLEVGAGAGSVAQWLSARIGPTGKVVATDINIKFLRQISVPNLEVRQHDITKDDLETGQYDLVHCRCLLMHGVQTLLSDTNFYMLGPTMFAAWGRRPTNPT